MTRTASKPEAQTKNNSEASDSLNYKSLIEKVTDCGDLLILANKGSGKTTLLKHLARELRANPENHLIIIETFPNWINTFDSIPYMAIVDNQIQPKENLPYLEESKSYIQWTKDYTITNANDIVEFLKTNKDCLFLIESDDMEKISSAMSFLIGIVYRKQYVRAKYNRLERVKERYWFLVEESHNLLDSTTVQKKTFQKLRKQHNEFRNLRMHLICVALRLQDLNPKIRSKMSILLSKVSLDDYQLKIRALLRNSKYRDIITALPKGTFVFPETDQQLTVEPFNQQGKPYLWQKTTNQPENKGQPQQPKKPSFLKALLITLTEGSESYIKRHPEIYNQQSEQSIEANLDDTDEGDGLMTLEESDILLPPDNPEVISKNDNLNNCLKSEKIKSNKKLK